MTIQLFDALQLDASSVRKTSGGYLTAFARVARTGVQDYKGKEVGRPDLDVVRVYRPDAEVFSDDTMASFAHRPVTFNHPPVAVDAKNWKQFAVGQTGGDVVQDGKFIRVPLVLMDAETVRRVEDGCKELSMGYTTELKWEKGLTTDGLEYDAIQTEIKGNHLAVVAAARGGAELRLGDHTPAGDKQMTTKTIMVDGVTLEMTDTAAQVVGRALATADEKVKASAKEAEDERKKAADAKTASDAAAATAKTALDEATGKIAVLTKQVADAAMTPEKLDVLVKDRQAVIDKAKAIAGDKLVTDGKTVDAIRREVVVAKLGDAACKDMDDGVVNGAFTALTASVKDAKVVPGGTTHLARSFSDSRPDATAARDAAWNDSGAKMRDAWKGPQATRQ